MKHSLKNYASDTAVVILDRFTIIELQIRHRHLLAGGGGGSRWKTT